MIFDIYDKVVTKKKVTQEIKDLLVSNNIKPGTEGEVQTVFLEVKFGDKTLLINADYVELKQEPKKDNPYINDDTMDFLKGVFGMK